jgi:hypothetical protein
MIAGRLPRRFSARSPEVIAMATPEFAHVLVSPIDICRRAFRALEFRFVAEYLDRYHQGELGVGR